VRRLIVLLPVLIAFQAGAPPALAWTWPVDGPVLHPFVFGDNPYAAGQHRGVDVGAPAGAPVRAPAAGTVSFAGTVPRSGRTVTIRTADGYSVTLVHLGAVGVVRGAAVAEGAAVGAVGPSGEAEHDRPYVHLGVRVTSDPQGYVDPLGLLPPRPPSQPPPAPTDEERAGDAPLEPLPEVAPEAPAPVEEAPPAAEIGPGEPAPVGEAPPVGEARPGEPDEAVQPPAEVAPPAPARAASPRAVAGARPAHAPARLAVGDGAPDRAGVSGSPAQADEVATAGGRVSRETAPPPSSDRPAERPAEPATTPAGSLSAGRPSPLVLAFPLVAALVLGAPAAWVRRRRSRLASQLGELGQAGSTDALPAVLLDPARLAAEDAARPGPAEEDGLVLDGDLEWIPLRESEALADLDRDHDPAELVQVANDPRRRRRPSSAAVSCRGGHGRLVHPSSRGRRPAPLAAR
jgi:hypothetical protein